MHNSNHQSTFGYLNRKLNRLLLLLVLGLWLVPSSLAQSGSGALDLQPPPGLSNEQMSEWHNLVQSYQDSERRRMSLEQRLSSYESSMNRTLERLGTLTSLLMDSQTDLAKSRASLEELKENLHELENRLEISQEQLALIQQELELSRQESENLKERLDALGGSLLGTEGSLTVLLEELTQVTSEYESLSIRYRELQTRLTASLARIGELDNRINILIAHINTSEDLIVALQLDLADAEKEQRRAFWRGVGIGAGGTGAVVLVIWLVSALAP